MSKNTKHLTNFQYRVTQQHETEPAYSGEYLNNKEFGDYSCVCCSTILFSSETKYDSGTGWPSFYKPVSEKVIGNSNVNSNSFLARAGTPTKVLLQSRPSFAIAAPVLNNWNLKFRSCNENKAKTRSISAQKLWYPATHSVTAVTRAQQLSQQSS